MATESLDLLQAGTAAKEIGLGRIGTLLGYIGFFGWIILVLQKWIPTSTWKALSDWTQVNQNLAIALTLSVSAIFAIYLWLFRKTISKEETRSFRLGTYFLHGNVAWRPILISYDTSIKNTIRVSGPLCPECHAPLFYDGADVPDYPESPKSAECPTCEKKYSFPRSIAIANALARRHAIGMSARKEIFQPLWLKWCQATTGYFRPLSPKG